MDEANLRKIAIKSIKTIGQYDSPHALVLASQIASEYNSMANRANSDIGKNEKNEREE